MKTRRNNRIGMNFETMEDRNMLAADIGGGFAMVSTSSEPMQAARADVSKIAASGDSTVAAYYNKLCFAYKTTETGSDT